MDYHRYIDGGSMAYESDLLYSCFLSKVLFNFLPRKA